MEGIVRILAFKIKALGLEKGFAMARLYRQWDEVVGQSLGGKFKKKSQPLKLSRDFLIVGCANSLWASEFQLRAVSLQRVLAEQFPEIKIKNLRFISR
ncbi:MAG: DUF721 domain-containing protein [Candidatus Portnoybacteria bacterium]|nr:DUF721 domain-containing protein [Candidatus Portnoybacteria bacterium]